MLLRSGKRSQIALEFMIVYSFVLVVFVVFFAIIATQRAATLEAQQSTALQLITQNIAGYIQQGLASGSGYNASIPLTGAIGSIPYNLTISSTGVVIAQMSVGTQVISAESSSGVGNLFINGTLLPQSGGGVALYSVPTYTGQIKITNINGVILIDRKAPTTADLAQSVSLTDLASAQAPQFNSQNTMIRVPDSAIGTGSELTLSVWFKPGLQVPGFYTDHKDIVRSECYGGGIWGIATDTYYNANNQLLFQTGWITGSSNLIPITAANDIAPVNRWSNFVLELDRNTGTATFYDNGNFGGSTLLSVGTKPTTTGFTITNDCAGIFNGTIANIQIYNGLLTSGQAQQLYQEGIEGAPVSQGSLVGWWPLNGNPNDNSGFANAGAPYNITYQNIAQVSAKATGSNGDPVVSVPIGFANNKGLMEGGAPYQVGITNAGGTTRAVANSTLEGLMTVAATAFNGNFTTSGSLLGWWPLNTGYGNTIYDYSGNNATGSFANPLWGPFSRNATNAQVALFNGAACCAVDSAITLQPSSPPVVFNNITMAAWVDPVGQTNAGSPYTVMETFGNQLQSSGVDLALETTVTSNGNVLAGLMVRNTGGSVQTIVGGQIPANTFSMLAATCDASGAKLYANGQLVNSVEGPCYSQAPFSTANLPVYSVSVGAPDTGYTKDFAGNMINVQLYNATLTQAQIGQLYDNGAAGFPLGQKGLALFMPLSGNAIDQSSSPMFKQSLSISQANLNYINMRIAPNQSSPNGYATFNGLASGGSIQVPTMPNNPGFYTVAMWFELNSSTSPTSTFDGGASPLAALVYPHGNGAVGSAWAGGANGVFGWESGGGGAPCNTPKGLIEPHVLYFGAAEVTHGGSTVSLYLNGENVSACAINPSSHILIPMSAMIGWATAPVISPNAYANATIGDVQVYGAALTPQQILQLYVDGLPPVNRMNFSLS